jgi:hypothetical protein
MHLAHQLLHPVHPVHHVAHLAPQVFRRFLVRTRQREIDLNPAVNQKDHKIFLLPQIYRICTCCFFAFHFLNN